MLSPVVDIEFYGDRFYNKPDVEETRKQLQSLLDRLEEYYGVKPLIYATEVPTVLISEALLMSIRSGFGIYIFPRIWVCPENGLSGSMTVMQSCRATAGKRSILT